jgi:hypothetical protein
VVLLRATIRRAYISEYWKILERGRPIPCGG